MEATVYIPRRKNSLPDISKTLRHLLTNRRAAFPVRIIDLAPAEAGLEDIRTEFPEVEILTPTIPDQAAVIAAVALHNNADNEADLFFLEPGILPPYGWDLRFQWAANAAPGSATVSPMCDTSRFFSVFPKNIEVSEHTFSQAENLIYRLSDKTGLHIPFFFPACFYLKAEALKAVSMQDFSDMPEPELPAALSKCFQDNGLINLLADHIYVLNTNAKVSIPVDAEKQYFLYLERHPLSKLRFILNDHSANNPLEDETIVFPGLKKQTAQLHIMHSWGGGLEKWVREFTQNQTEHLPFILKSVGTFGSYGERLALYDNVDARPLACFDISYPVTSTLLHHGEYKKILRAIAKEYSIEHLFISTFIGHTFDLFSLDMPKFIVCHDYYPLCPAINIITDKVCTSCSQENLSECLKNNPNARFFPDADAAAWSKLRNAYTEHVLEQNAMFVVPSPSVKEHMTQLEPRLEQACFIHIPHGVVLETFEEQKIEKKFSLDVDHDRFKIVVLGELSPQKGLHLFLKSAPELLKDFDIYLVGCGETAADLPKHKRLHVIKRYIIHELPELLEHIEPDLGLLLSVWPETFSYTLSELFHFNIPPAATRLGGFKDRIQDGKTGFLFEPNKASLLETVHKAAADKAGLAAIKETLRTTPARTVHDMVEDYNRLVQPEFSADQYLNPARPESASLAAGNPYTYNDFLSNYRYFFQYIISKVDTSKKLKGPLRFVLNRSLRAFNKAFVFAYNKLFG